MVVKFEVDSPFDKLEDRESLPRATPFGGKENGSNGSLYLLLVTRISAKKNRVPLQVDSQCVRSEEKLTSPPP